MNAAATTEWVNNKPLTENRCRKSQKNISRENAQQKSDKTHSTRVARGRVPARPKRDAWQRPFPDLEVLKLT